MSARSPARRLRRLAAVAAVAAAGAPGLLAIVLGLAAQGSLGQSPDPLAALKAKFERPRFVPHPADNPPTLTRSPSAGACSRTRRYPPPAPSPAPPATIRACLSPTASPPARASRASASHATRRPCGTWPSIRSCSGTGARQPWRTRCGSRWSTSTRWVAPLRQPPSASSRRRELSHRLRDRVPAEPGDFPAHHRRGPRRLRAHARLAADAVRCLGGGQGGRADPIGGAWLQAVHRQGPLHLLPRRLRLYRPQLLRHRPARHGCGPRQGDRPPRSRPRLQGPTLRELAWSAPYMHDGSLATLEEVVRHYERGGVARPTRSKDLPRGLRLTDAERADLVAFLETLSSETPPQPSTEPWVGGGRPPAPPPPEDASVVSQINKTFTPGHVRLKAGQSSPCSTMTRAPTTYASSTRSSTSTPAPRSPRRA